MIVIQKKWEEGREWSGLLKKDRRANFCFTAEMSS